MNTRNNISHLEDWLYQSLRESVCDHVITGHLPETIKDDIPEFAFFNVNTLTDTSEYGRNSGTADVEIYLYARPNTDGGKDLHRMSRLEDDLHAFIEDDHQDGYEITETYSSQGYDSNINLFYIVSVSRVTIQ